MTAPDRGTRKTRRSRGPISAALAALLAVQASWSCSDDHGVLALQELIDACVRATACDFSAYPRVSNCIDAYHGRYRVYGLGGVYDDLYRCINQARSCAAVFACAGTTADSSCDRTFQGRCQGARAVSCDLIDHRVYELDCAAGGLSCATGSTESFAASCTPGRCEAGVFDRRCDGTRALSCHDGVIAIDDCGARGLRCEHGPAGAVCAGSGGPCAGELPRCDGSVAVTCVGGMLHRRDCGGDPLATRCQAGACQPAGDDCVDDFDRCAGDGELQTCLDGRWAAVSCARLGLGRCVPGKSGAACGRD